MVRAVAGVSAKCHFVTPREACGWLKVHLKGSVILRSTDKLNILEHIRTTSLFHHKWLILDADAGVSDEGAVVGAVGEVGEVVAALARTRRRIGSQLPSSVVL